MTSGNQIIFRTAIAAEPIIWNLKWLDFVGSDFPRRNWTNVNFDRILQRFEKFIVETAIDILESSKVYYCLRKQLFHSSGGIVSRCK